MQVSDDVVGLYITHSAWCMSFLHRPHTHTHNNLVSHSNVNRVATGSSGQACKESRLGINILNVKPFD